MTRLKSVRVEWLARRAGRRKLANDIARSARDIVGPTGLMLSEGWDQMAKHQEAYVGSFDRRVPPSIFVSERERTRYNIPIPLAERMISEHGKTDRAEEHQNPPAGVAST